MAAPRFAFGVRGMIPAVGIAMCRTPMRVYTQGRFDWFQ
jgi:hypothetical protein